MPAPDAEAVFPIVDVEGHAGVPWPCLASFLPRIWENHRLTCVSLAKIGLTASEAVAILEDRPLKIMNLEAAATRLDELIATWRAGRCRLSWGRSYGRFQGIAFDAIRSGPSADGSRATDYARPKKRNDGRRNRPSPSGW